MHYIADIQATIPYEEIKRILIQNTMSAEAFRGLDQGDLSEDHFSVEINPVSREAILKCTYVSEV